MIIYDKDLNEVTLDLPGEHKVPLTSFFNIWDSSLSME